MKSLVIAISFILLTIPGYSQDLNTMTSNIRLGYGKLVNFYDKQNIAFQIGLQNSQKYTFFELGYDFNFVRTDDRIIGNSSPNFWNSNAPYKNTWHTIGVHYGPKLEWYFIRVSASVGLNFILMDEKGDDLGSKSTKVAFSIPVTGRVELFPIQSLGVYAAYKYSENDIANFSIVNIGVILAQY